MAERQPKSIQLWIVGLHHSGTTIFWKAWRRDSRFLCFDEPLSGDIGFWFPRNNSKGTHDEYVVSWGGRPAEFWRYYAPIEPNQELDNRLSERQERWLSLLFSLSPNVVVDETHLHFHLPTIRKLTPNGLIIHLHRRASSFVTSHLIPSRARCSRRNLVLNLRYRLGTAYRRRTFWTNCEIPPGMGRHRVVGQHPQSKLGLRLADAGYDVQRIMRSSAVVRLLAYWHYCYHQMERNGRALFGPRFTGVAYEDFATRPQEVMTTLYSWLGIDAPRGVDYSDVHSPRPPFLASDQRWREAARLAGFTDEEIQTLL